MADSSRIISGAVLTRSDELDVIFSASALNGESRMREPEPNLHTNLIFPFGEEKLTRVSLQGNSALFSLELTFKGSSGEANLETSWSYNADVTRDSDPIWISLPLSSRGQRFRYPENMYRIWGALPDRRRRAPVREISDYFG